MLSSFSRKDTLWMLLWLGFMAWGFWQEPLQLLLTFIVGIAFIVGMLFLFWAEWRFRTSTRLGKRWQAFLDRAGAWLDQTWK